MCELTGNPRPFLPKSLRRAAFQACHDLDHCGQAETLRRLDKSYFWPKMSKETSEYVKSCHWCQSVKTKRKFTPKARPFKVPDKRFRQLHIDVVGPLPVSEGMSYLLTIICRKSKWVECVPMPAANSLNVCNAFIRAWLSRFGACEEIFSDNGNTFLANMWTDLNRILGIKVTYVPRYHQATNGAIERRHRSIKDSLKASLLQMGDTYGSSWMLQLPFTLLGLRASLQPDLGASPSDMTTGSSPLLPGVMVDDQQGEENDHQLLQTLKKLDAEPPIPMSRHRPQDDVYMPPATKTATHVYIKVENPTGLSNKWQGPFPIVKRPTNTTITIKVGYNKQGLPLLEDHHWSRVQIAHMRPDASEAHRLLKGRTKRPVEESRYATTPQKQNTQPIHFTEYSDANINTPVTQPFIASDADPSRRLFPQGENFVSPSSHHDALSYNYRVTGPPPVAFRRNQNKFSSEPTSLPEPGLEPGREPLPPEVNGRLAPPVTKGAPTASEPSAGPTTRSSVTQPGHGTATPTDHDYIQTAPHLSDHNYFVRPPPGFEHYRPEGRPKRNIKFPSKFDDYDLT